MLKTSTGLSCLNREVLKMVRGNQFLCRLISGAPGVSDAIKFYNWQEKHFLGGIGPSNDKIRFNAETEERFPQIVHLMDLSKGQINKEHAEAQQRSAIQATSSSPLEIPPSEAIKNYIDYLNRCADLEVPLAFASRVSCWYVYGMIGRASGGIEKDHPYRDILSQYNTIKFACDVNEVVRGLVEVAEKLPDPMQMEMWRIVFEGVKHEAAFFDECAALLSPPDPSRTLMGSDTKFKGTISGRNGVISR